MTELVIGRRHIPYRLVRSDAVRKLKLHMTMDEFLVTVPETATEPDIQLALSRKHKWIIENYEALQEKYEQTHKVARFRTGAKLPYWGRLTKLTTQLADVSKPSVSYRNGFYVEHPNYASSRAHDDGLEAALHEFLKQQFTLEAMALIGKYSSVLGTMPRRLRIMKMSKRWGSCTPAGAISLDWRLVYAPKRVAGYVVAHELTHLRMNNHSPRFQALLRQVHGDYEREYQWLMANEHLLGYHRLAAVIGED